MRSTGLPLIDEAFSEVAVFHFGDRPLDWPGDESGREFPFDGRREFDPARIQIVAVPALGMREAEGDGERFPWGDRVVVGEETWLPSFSRTGLGQ